MTGKPSWDRKRDWSRKHLDEIETILEKFYDADAYQMLRKFDINRSAYLYRVISKEPPEDLPLMVGDCVHNMRSSLDHLIWEFSRRGSADPDTMITFPLSETAHQWASWKGRFGQGLDTHVLTAIEGLQVHDRPQPAREPPVLLHKLDRDDKHQLVLTVNSSTQSTAMYVGYQVAPGIMVGASSMHVGPFGDSTEVASKELRTFSGKPLTKDPGVNVKPGISLCVGFAEESPAIGECVDILLLRCLNYVDRVLTELRPLL